MLLFIKLNGDLRQTFKEYGVNAAVGPFNILTQYM